MTRRIHIVGSSPRTGTTLLVELMRYGFRVDGFSAHEWPIFRGPPHPCSIFLSKRPRDVLVASTMLTLDPSLWILHLVRDPRDVVVSRHRRARERYWTNLRLWHRYRRAARRAADHPRFLTLRYEDLVRDPDGVQERIQKFLPFLKYSRSFSEVHGEARPSPDSLDALGEWRPISPASIGRWREHKPRVVAQIALHGSIDRDLVELGYESGGCWREALRGVRPENGESALPDHPSRVHRLAMGTRRRLELLRCWQRARRRSSGDLPPRCGPFAVEAVRAGAATIEIGSLGQGPLVVLLPGLGGAGTEQFMVLGEALARDGFMAVAINPRGVGASRGPMNGLTLHDFARDVEAVIAHHGASAHVVGRAFGNRVVRCLAQDAPHRVRSVVLLAAGGLVRPGKPKILRRRGGRRYRNWRAAGIAQKRADRATPLREWWDGGVAPLLVVQGLDDDTAVPENGRRLAEDHPERVRLVEVERAGHDPLAERPTVVVPAVLSFLHDNE